jgi:LysM repeat protein
VATAPIALTAAKPTAQSTTLDYGIIMKASFSTNTTLTIQVPEGCTIPTSGGVNMDTKTYQVLKGGESIYDIARKVNMPSGELLEHNGLDNETQIIPEDTVIRLPYDRQIKVDKPIEYEVFDKPKQMHVIIAEGIKKFSLLMLKNGKT